MAGASAEETILARRMPHPPGLFYLLVRLGLGLLFVYLGWAKASDPVGFLKSVREYGVITEPPWLNLVAAALPWFEIFCGVLWILGLGTRGTALVVLVLMSAFTLLVWRHATELQVLTGLPFCQIQFDCGCGGGPVRICAKLVENSVTLLGTVWVLIYVPKPAAKSSAGTGGAVTDTGGGGC